MKITPCGAVGEVTGSGYLVQTGRARVLVDFGLFQGSPDAGERNLDLGPVDPATLDAVVVTHAHIDHTGRLPLLVARGYRGPIFATEATIALVEVLLLDSARIQEADAERANRKRAEQPGGGATPTPRKPAAEAVVRPAYTAQDVDRLIGQLRPVEFDRRRDVAPGVTLRCFEAGHILGSASVELRVKGSFARRDGSGAKADERVLVFSGDIGPKNSPIIRDPVPPTEADLVVLESTYGDRDHPKREDTILAFKELMASLLGEHKGRVIVPAFAVGRTQNLMYLLAEAMREKAIPDIPVYLDSPMALKASRIYGEQQALYDAATNAILARNKGKGDLHTLKVIETPEESKRLNMAPGPCVIIASSGMCEGGRIVHHLRHALPRPQDHVLIAGYMGKGTLGRKLVDGEKRVEVLGYDTEVKARIHELDGLSAHAGRSELLDWLAPVAAARPRVVLTHGEDDRRAALAEGIKDCYGLSAVLPGRGESIELD